MDIVKLATDEWAVIAAAPVLSLALLAVGAGVTWIVRNWLDNREIAGLRAKAEAVGERLQLAHEKLEDANKARDDALAFLNQLQSQVIARVEPTQIATTASTTVSSILLWRDQISGLAKILEPPPAFTAYPPIFKEKKVYHED